MQREITQRGHVHTLPAFSSAPAVLNARHYPLARLPRLALQRDDRRGMTPWSDALTKPDGGTVTVSFRLLTTNSDLMPEFLG